MKKKFNLIRSWPGRVGNNMIALGNVIYYSKMRNQRLRYRKHWIFPPREFNFGDNIEELRAFYGSTAYQLDREFENFHLHRYEILQGFIYPLIIEDDSEIDSPHIINIEQKPVDIPEEADAFEDKKLDSMMLNLITPRRMPKKKSKKRRKTKKPKQFLIHIRSGDIIKDSRLSVHKTYVQSPNSYIRYILDKEQPEKIVVLYEDERNPMVPFLKDNYGSIICPKQSGSQSLRGAIAAILDSEILVQTGVTSFLSAISLCSRKLERIYIPKYEAIEAAKYKTPFTIMGNKYNPSVDVRYVVHKDYIKVGDWKGKPDQSLCF